jgi:hypothetical protein
VSFDPYAELVRIAAALEAAGVAYALCGGLALAVPADLERIREVVRREGFVIEALPMTFPSGVTMRRFTKIVEARPLPLDLLVVTGPLEPIFLARLSIPWEGTTLQVVDREGLVVLKSTAGRPQDLVDIQRLMEVGPDTAT